MWTRQWCTAWHFFFTLVSPPWGEWSGTLRGTKVAPYATTVAPHFFWARQKTASKIITKQCCSTSATCIPIMTFCAVVINLSPHQYHVLAPVLLSDPLEWQCMTSLAYLFLMHDSDNLVLGRWNAVPSGHNYILCSFLMQLHHICMIRMLFFSRHSW